MISLFFSCEVIRDPKSGDSLQYAFVEFEDKRSCEAAYFKMDNVLIDDRRIHVDFSQSVAKMRWRGKGKGVEHFDKVRICFIFLGLSHTQFLLVPKGKKYIQIYHNIGVAMGI